MSPVVPSSLFLLAVRIDGWPSEGGKLQVLGDPTKRAEEIFSEVQKSRVILITIVPKLSVLSR